MAIEFPTNNAFGVGYDYRQDDAVAAANVKFIAPYTMEIGPYHFDASDAGPTDVDSEFTNESNGFDGSEYTSASFAGPGPGVLKATGTNAPASGPSLSGKTVSARVSYSWAQRGVSNWSTVTAPSGGWTYAKLQALHLELDWDHGVPDSSTSIYESDGGTLLWQVDHGGTDLFELFKVEIGVFDTNNDENYWLVLALGDDEDEVWSPPHDGLNDFTEFFEVNDAGGDDASIGGWYGQQTTSWPRSQITLRRTSGSTEEQMAIIMTVTGVDDTTFEDVTFVSGSHFVSTQDVDGTPDITPKAITTNTDNAVVVIVTGNRSDAGHLNGSASVWSTSPPSGYTIESGTYSGAGNTIGAPGRLERGIGNGDPQMTWMWKEVTTAGTETPGDITGFSSGRDMKTVTFAIKPAATGTAHTETATDPVGVTDDTSRVHTAERTVTDDAGVTDNVDDVKTGLSVETVIRPVSDTDAAGWDTAPTASQELWPQLDEVTPSDTDYIFAEDG